MIYLNNIRIIIFQKNGKAMPTHIYSNPQSYSKNNDLQASFAMSVLPKINIKPDSRILDLGSGDGRITSELARKASEGCVIGSDISDEMVKYANTTYSSQSNLLFVKMDMSKNVFKNQFDIITSFNSLHWVKDQISALKGIAAAAASSAQVVLLLSHRKSQYHIALDVLSISSQWSKYFINYENPRSFFTKEQYRMHLQDAGLQEVSIIENEMTYEFTSIIELKSFFSSSMANIKQIPDYLKDDFLEDYCAEFLKQSKCNDSDHIPVSFWCLEVIATKIQLEYVLEECKEQISGSFIKSTL